MADDAKAYIKKHNLNHVMDQLMTSILHQRPVDPRALMIRKLEDIKAARARGQNMIIFTRENLAAVFKIFDTTGKGYLTKDQYISAMEDIGAYGFNENPAGADQDRISNDTFVDNAMQALAANRN
ncbi:EF-hand calcium-binding domain-containing protein 10 [Irineochytrium annulatum]|nr:EF-hand calcium-binding domain-containing protein 10 [Irineochytrium annulatum]